MRAWLNIIIVGTFKFPSGEAAAVRVRTLAKGLKEAGGRVRALSTYRIVEDEKKLYPAGERTWKGVDYEFINCVPTSADLSFAKRAANYATRCLKAYSRVKALIKAQQCDSIIVYGQSFALSAALLLLAKLYRKPLLLEVCEWVPPSHFKGGLLNPEYWGFWAALRVIGPHCQGIIAISTYIKNKYATSRVPCLLIPSIYDFSEVSLQRRDQGPSDLFEIVYAGIGKKNDGLTHLLTAIKLVASEGCPIVLRILGANGNSGLGANELQVCDEDELLQDRVFFMGWVSDEAYHNILSSAHCLVLPRLDGQTSRASFPTRLPEYLATGVPVLTSSTGDIPLYLEAGVHAEIVPSGKARDLADGLLRLWKDPERANTIGHQGQKRAAEVFDYSMHTQNLFSFIQKARKDISA